MLVALMLAAGGVVTSLALWEDREPQASPANIATAAIPAMVPTPETSVPASVQAAIERSAAAVTPTDERELAAAGPEIRVQLIGGSTGAPAADQPGFVLRSGEYDHGRAFSLAGEMPNPEPIASGITGPDGVAWFALSGDDLIDLCTERSERLARGSWAIRIEDGEALPATCELFCGTTFRGRVVDDVGDPVAGLLLQTPSFTDEWLTLGTTDETGAFELPRCADFPRSFVIREDEKVEPSRTLPTAVTVMDGPAAVTSLELMAHGVEAKALPDTVISRRLRLSGSIVDGQRRPVKGALVSTQSRRVSLTSPAAKYDRQPLTLPWNDDGFELQEGEALTDASGHFALEVHPRRRAPAELDLVAFSPGGAMEVLSLTGLRPGEERTGLSFELDNSETVRLRLISASPNDGPIRWDSNPDRTVTLIWDASKDPGVPRPLERVTTIAGPDVSLPLQQLPDRSLYGGRLRGTLDVPGYRAARVALDAGVYEATVPLELSGATAESPFVVRAQINSWPERERKDRPALKEGESAAIVARRPTTVVARLVDGHTQDFLREAKAVSVDSAHRHLGNQRLWNGEEQPMRLESSMEQLTLRFAATGYRSHVMGPLALAPGTEVDLGTIPLEPLDKIQCTLLRPDGTSVKGVHVMTWTDPVAGWTRVKSSEEGVAVLFAGDDLPEWIKVKAREGSNDPEQLLKPVRTGPHTCALEVPAWRRVRLRVEGIGVPLCYGVERIRVVGMSPDVDMESIESTIWWPCFDGDALVFDTRLPPGKWTVKPSNPDFVTFPDTAIWIDGGAASDSAPAEFTVTGTATVR